jgi:hypothetical protein
METMNVGERLLTISILPVTGNFITMNVVRGIIKKLTLSNEDMISYDIMVGDGGNVSWNAKGSIETIDVEIDAVEMALIQKSLRELDESGGLTQETLPIYEKFLNRR